MSGTIDSAPRSTRFVFRRVLGLADLTEYEADRIKASTHIDHADRAVTAVARPVVQNADRQTEIDKAIMAALRKLPGADPGVSIDMGRQYTVTWDGVRAPV
jgi:hypothetical protein